MRKCKCKYNNACLAVRQDRQAKLRDETGKKIEECVAYKVKSGLENKDNEVKEKSNKVLRLDIKGIQCDNPKCDYLNGEVSIEDYEKWINKKCPKCGEILLTKEEYEIAKSIMNLTEHINGVVGLDLSTGKDKSIRVKIGTGKLGFTEE